MRRRTGTALIFLAMTGIFCGCSVINRIFTVDKEYLTLQAIDSLFRPSSSLEEFYYPCSADIGPTRRRMLVYLPPDYYGNTEEYPVLYLLHGARGNETSWIKDGGLVEMLDTLRRKGECRDFIVVLPNTNQYDDDADYGLSRFKNAMESFFEVNGAVESSFVNDVVGFVESNFRVRADKSDRAIAGLSIGALQCIYISALNPHMFDYVGLFSPLWQPWPPQKSPYSGIYKDLRSAQREQFSDTPRIYSLAVGTADPLYGHVEDYRHYLNKNGFCYIYEESKGGHDWYNWSEYLETFVKSLF